jgi:hypothetical protein
MGQQQNSKGVTAELRATRTADPRAEVRKAIKRGDLRFLAVGGFGAMVPGVPGGPNPVVEIRGARIISGTGDALESEEQLRLQPIAEKYAALYNRLLFDHLMRVNDSSIGEARRRIDQELLRLERADPQKDAEQEVKKPYLQLIKLFSFSDQVPGIDPKALEAAQDARDVIGGVFGYSVSADVFVPEVMTSEQRRRLAHQIRRYIIPYNKYVFAHGRAFPIKPQLKKSSCLLSAWMRRR